MSLCIFVVLLCFVSTLGVIVVDESDGSGVQRRRSIESAALDDRPAPTARDEPITCSTMTSVQIGKTVSVGAVKIISEGSFGGMHVLVVQPHNSSFYRAHLHDVDFAERLVGFFAAERDHLRIVQHRSIVHLLGGCWDVRQPFKTMLVIEYLEVRRSRACF